MQLLAAQRLRDVHRDVYVEQERAFFRSRREAFALARRAGVTWARMVEISGWSENVLLNDMRAIRATEAGASTDSAVG